MHQINSFQSEITQTSSFSLFTLEQENSNKKISRQKKILRIQLISANLFIFLYVQVTKKGSYQFYSATHF